MYIYKTNKVETRSHLKKRGESEKPYEKEQNLNNNKMKNLLILVTMLLTFGFANAQRMYDGSGRPIGRVDGERYYDGSGRPIGRVDAQRIYDGSGRPIGRIDGDRLYDGSGRPIGRADGLRRMQIILFFYFYM